MFSIHISGGGGKSYSSLVVLNKYKDSMGKVLSCIENEGAYKIDGIKSLSILYVIRAYHQKLNQLYIIK